jgi:hypothetical protein
MMLRSQNGFQYAYDSMGMSFEYGSYISETISFVGIPSSVKATKLSLSVNIVKFHFLVSYCA